MADCIANLAIHNSEMHQIRSFNELLKEGGFILNIDKVQFSTIRIKSREIKIHAYSQSKI